jgi:hypothetical protein
MVTTAGILKRSLFDVVAKETHWNAASCLTTADSQWRCLPVACVYLASVFAATGYNWNANCRKGTSPKNSQYEFSVTEEYQDGEKSYCEFFGLGPFLQLAIPLSPWNMVGRRQYYDYCCFFMNIGILNVGCISLADNFLRL